MLFGREMHAGLNEGKPNLESSYFGGNRRDCLHLRLRDRNHLQLAVRSERPVGDRECSRVYYRPFVVCNEVVLSRLGKRATYMPIRRSMDSLLF